MSLRRSLPQAAHTCYLKAQEIPVRSTGQQWKMLHSEPHGSTDAPLGAFHGYIVYHSWQMHAHLTLLRHALQ